MPAVRRLCILLDKDTMTFLLLMLLLSSPFAAGGQFPAPAQDQAAKPAGSRDQEAVLAAGCFWGVEAVFERLIGVKDVVSGYAGGSKNSANYRVVSTGTTEHAESVKITYDPSKITYGQLLKVFFAVAHDPTQLNRQGPDEGPQYRSAIFFSDEEQRTVADAYIKQLNDAKIFPRRIVTTVVTLHGFYPAEPDHQNFVRRNPDYPYVVVHDLPKLEHLRKAFPELLKQK
jgi:peptide-methionine (S)-S-oxide reductase